MHLYLLPLSNGTFAAYNDQGRGYRNPYVGTLQPSRQVYDVVVLPVPKGTRTVSVAPGWDATPTPNANGSVYLVRVTE